MKKRKLESQDATRESLQRVVLKPGDILVPDTNVMLSAIGFNNALNWEGILWFLIANIKSLRVPRKVQEEMEGVMNCRDVHPEYHERLTKIHGYKLIEHGPDPNVLSHLRNAHKRVANDPESNKAADWLRAKQSRIESKRDGKAAVPSGMGYDEKAARLCEIYEDAESDRVIAAQAAALALKRGPARVRKDGVHESGGTVYLVTDDSDITLFAGKVLDATNRMVKPIRLEQLVDT